MLARESGVSANLRIELPGRFLWRVVQQLVSGTAQRPPFDPLVVRWAIYDALDNLPSGAPFDVIGQRWQQAGGGARIALATDLGSLFERYLAYRREWLNRWGGDKPVTRRDHNATATDLLADNFGAHEPWQRWLWQQVLARLDGLSQSHPFDDFANHVARTDASAAAEAQTSGGRSTEASAQRGLFDDGLAPDGVGDKLGRIVMLGLLSMPPEQMQLFAQLGKLTDVIWFTSDPAQGFWEDLVNQRRAAQIALESPDDTWLYLDQPAILGEWGRQQRDFLAAVRQLEAQGEVQVIEDALRTRDVPTPHHLLSSVQAAVFALSDLPLIDYIRPLATGLRDDPSLQIHSCHSLVRQIEVIHDSLLAAFDELPGLTPAQVAIFCTDLETAAPLVQAVFGAGSQARLPVRISGRGSDVSAQVRAFQLFLDLVQGPAHVSNVLEWLNCDAARQVCQLDDALLGRVQSALEQAGAQRDDLNDPDSTNKHGWHRGLQRLVLAAFTGEDEAVASGSIDASDAPGEPIAGILPAGRVDSALASALGYLVELLNDIRALRRPAAVAPTDSAGAAGNFRRVDEWSRLLIAWTDRWLSACGPNRDGLFVVRDALVQLTETTGGLVESVRERAVPFSVVAQALHDQLNGSNSAARPSGAITVAPFGALRQTPYRVCAVLGLDQGKWPASVGTAEYDLMRAEPRFGDPSATNAARGTFLDVVLDTSDRLILSFTGRDDRSNQISNPARVVIELADYIAARCRDAGRSGAEADARGNEVVRHHPLQPFSVRRFAPSAHPSYAQPWFDTAVRLADPALTRVAIGAVQTMDAAGAAGATDNDESAIGSASSPASSSIVNIETITDAMLNSSRYLMQNLGAMSVSRQENEPDDIEPMEQSDLGQFDRPDLLSTIVLLHRSGRSGEKILSWLQAHPLLPGGPVARHLAENLLAEMQQMLAREEELLRQFGSPRPVVPIQPSVRVPVTLPNQSVVLLTGRLDPIYQLADGNLLQVLPPVDKARIHDVLSLWHQHLLLLASDLPGAAAARTIRSLSSKPAGMRDTYLGLAATPPGVDSPLSGLAAAVLTYQDICRRPYLLFPRTAQAWLQRSDSIVPDPDNFVANKAARTAYLNEDGPYLPESKKPWPVAMWRDSPPLFQDVLRDSLAVYGPVWRAVTGNPVADNPMTDNPSPTAGIDPLGDDPDDPLVSRLISGL